jgi:hypothetical protein
MRKHSCCNTGVFACTAGFFLALAFVGLTMAGLVLFYLGGSEPIEYRYSGSTVQCMPDVSDQCPAHECETYTAGFWRDECQRCVDHRREDWKAVKKLCCTDT